MSELTVGDQQELCDAAWILLKAWRNNSACVDYILARKIALAVTEVRDKQLDLKAATSDISVL